ncbi:MAG: hypothetical protein IKW93_06445 [Bacteroidales bacterium]|nr:hypothetical protein [Bacteroidales bacterium]
MILLQKESTGSSMLYINGKQVENNINSIRAAITKLTSEQKKMTIGSDE